MLTREQACALLVENGITPPLTLHALASEAVLGAMARHLGEDEKLWSLAGLLHDLDYPATAETPEKHGVASRQMLENALPESALDAIARHNGEMNGCLPQTAFDYALRCGETVTGLVHAAALMRPTGYDGMQVKSIKKKMKDRAFAANVNRDNIRECEKAGIPLDDFLALAIQAMANMPDKLE